MSKEMALEVQKPELAFTEKQEALVKESWEILKPNIPQLSMRLFSLIVEVAPQAKNAFYFLRESDELPENNPKLKAHAAKVFKLTGESVLQLREKGVVAGSTTLKHLGHVHLKNGITEPQFEVVKVAFLQTIKEGVGEKWTEELNGAWSDAYDHLATAIIAEMNQQATANVVG